MVNITNPPNQSTTPSSSTQPDTLVSFQHNTSTFSYASPSGTTNDVNGGFPRFVGKVRLTVTLAAGDAIWTGLGAGADGQEVLLWNNDATNSLTLQVKNAGSVPRNQFNGSSMGYMLLPGFTLLLVYYAGVVNAWVVR
jgi:hypothetical protein